MQTSSRGRVRLTRLTFVRVIPLAVVGGLAAAVLAMLAINYQESEPTARVEVGISQAVTWPFFEVVVGKAESTASELGPLVQSELGKEFIGYRVEREEGSLLFDLVVVASSGDAAMTGAEAAFDATVAGLIELRSEPILASLVVLEESLDMAVLAAEDEAAAYVAALEATGSAETDSEFAQARSAEEGLATSRSALDYEVLELRSAIADAGLELALVPQDIQIVSRTSAEAADNSTSRVAGAIGLGAGALLALGLFAADRSHGPIRSAKQVEEELGLRCLAADKSGSVSTELERVVHHAGASGHRCLLIEGPDSDVRSAGRWSGLTLSDFMLPDSMLDDPEVQLVVDQVAQAHLLGRCSAAIVMVPKDEMTLRALRRQVARNETSGLEVVGVLLT